MLLRATSSRSPTVHMQIGNEHFLFYGSVIVASSWSNGKQFRLEGAGKRVTKATTEWFQKLDGLKQEVVEVSRRALEVQFRVAVIGND